MSRKRREIKRLHLVELFSALVLLIAVNVISSFTFYRLDMTTEKRYSLSEASISLLKSLDDIVFVRVYLEGDFPAGFKRLRKETREMLDEFRAYSKNIEYEFVDPSNAPDRKTLNSIYQQLVEKGLEPTVIQVEERGGSSEKVIFPSALIHYKGREVPVQLLKNQFGVAPEFVLNNSVQALEYELSNAIRKLTIPIKQKIGFVEGNGELSSVEMGDIMQSLREYYVIDRVNINGQLKALREYSAIIIAKPEQPYDEKDKFIIDQFIMRGGKVLWFVDPVSASMDSLQHNGFTMGFGARINLEDQLFRYGVRLNTTLLQDFQALTIPIVVGNIGNQPQINHLPWFYFPLLIPANNHPIVKNLNMIKTEFVSSIDTIPVPGIKKTFLLTTAKNSRVINTPVRISLDLLHSTPNEKQYRRAYQPAAVLLEGEFPSSFRNRIPPVIKEDPDINYRDISVPNKMIVVADGDILKNQLRATITGDTTYYPLGFDRYTNKTYGNKNFVLNAVNYLCDDSNLISVRAREIKLRMLNAMKIKNERSFWQLLNLGVPILLIFLFGFILKYIKYRKYRLK